MRISRTDDCESCGACCLSSSDSYVPLTRADAVRLVQHGAARYIAVVDGEQVMCMDDGRCSALHIEGGRFSCELYAARPETCRTLEAGSAACEEERRLKRRSAARLVRD